ncbi:hypothetical protein QL285_038949 [Trifolium repens]|nr:hypothetical protein QL285_038949 [Trifolium repens]
MNHGATLNPSFLHLTAAATNHRQIAFLRLQRSKVAWQLFASGKSRGNFCRVATVTVFVTRTGMFKFRFATPSRLCF